MYINIYNKNETVGVIIKIKLKEDQMKSREELLKLAKKWEWGWKYISEYQKLPEDFIREFQDRVDWAWISWNQKLSADFIIELWNELKEYGKPKCVDFRKKEYKNRNDLKLLLRLG